VTVILCQNNLYLIYFSQVSVIRYSPVVTHVEFLNERSSSDSFYSILLLLLQFGIGFEF